MAIHETSTKQFPVSPVNTGSHALKATTIRTYAKKKLPVRPKPCREGEEEKERQLQSVMRERAKAINTLLVMLDQQKYI